MANNQFRLEFFQKEPVGGKVASAEYNLYMADKSGAAVREVAGCHLLCNVEPVNGELAKCDADVDSASVAALADEVDQSFGVYRQIVQPRALLGRARR